MFQTVLALISTIIGGGLVGIPFAFYHAGIPLALVLNVLGAALNIFASYLYIKAKDFSGLE